MRRRWTTWRAPKPYGPLGDLMTPSERATWRVMGVYRRWSVFFALQLLTVVWWTHAGWFPGGVVGWNALWSDLAIVVEMMVGIALLGQTQRDGRVLRTELSEAHEVLADVRAELDLLRRICTHLGIDPDAGDGG